MSLGGLTSMELAVRHPHVVRSLVMVDVTPGVNSEKTKAITDFVDGPQAFASFDELLDRTKQFNPTRSESSLRRGILHNAAPRATDRGSGATTVAAVPVRNRLRKRRLRRPSPSEPTLTAETIAAVMNPLWDDFAAIAAR